MHAVLQATPAHKPVITAGRAPFSSTNLCAGVWFQNHGTEGWLNMAGVFLCLTGCEAMFADMGHFNRQSIQVCHVGW